MARRHTSHICGVRAEIVAGIIKTKTERGLYVPHPDAPDEEEARLYKMFDATMWDHLSERREEGLLEGAMSGLDPKVDTNH